MPQLSRFVPWKFWIGMGLIAFALFVPLVVSAQTLGIYDKIAIGLRLDNQILLLGATFRLVAKNLIYCLPLYLGSFFLSASFWMEWRGRFFHAPNLLLLVGVISSVYALNDHLYGITYAVGVPFFVIPALQLILWALDYPYVSMMRKSPVVLAMLTGFQFVDLMPALEHLPFGRDASAVYLKSIMVGEGMRNTLNVAMASCAFICFSTAFLLLLLIHNENRLIQINQLKAENNEILLNSKMKELQNRSTTELRHLVHDLKTPLTSIQTLAYVVRLHNQEEDKAECREYLTRIEGSVEHMSNMISEILYEDYRLSITTTALLNIVLAQLSATPYTGAIHVENLVPHATINVNSIRMARALINLIENASHAEGELPLSIRLRVELREQDDRQWVTLSVIDNGVGIPENQLEHIWLRGHSTQNSSGLGLPFVQETVENCGGTIHIQSEVSHGTEITIFLPLGAFNHEQ